MIEKLFVSDYPRGIVNCFWLWCFPAFGALSVATVLTVPFLLARRRLPVSLLCLPPRPFSCLLPAVLAAIPLACVPRMKALVTPFEERSEERRVGKECRSR